VLSEQAIDQPGDKSKKGEVHDLSSMQQKDNDSYEPRRRQQKHGQHTHFYIIMISSEG
jgi:hypothetical protein